MLQQGMKLNDTYILLERLGAGGGGIVYKAWHERLQTYVVLKQIREEVRGILSSRAEADILKNIKHPYLPRVYDFLELNGDIFTVMDYIPGKSMEEALKEEGRFSPKEVFQWTLQLAEALNYLHSQTPPVIHSDIKPANIMLTPERTICLIDFNVSLAFDSSMRTSMGVSCGYSPPEQYRDYGSYIKQLGKYGSGFEDTVTMQGAASTEAMLDHSENKESLIVKMPGQGVDERSDIYSLGSTLYHFLTGIRPSNDYEQIVPLADYNLELGEGFIFIIEKMMSLAPEKRYQNGSALLYALEHIYQLDLEYQTCQKRNKVRKWLITAAFTAGISMIAGGWFMMDREALTTYYHSLSEAKAQIELEEYEAAAEIIQSAIHSEPDRIQAYAAEMLRLYSMGCYEKASDYGWKLLEQPVYKLRDNMDNEELGNIYFILGNSCFMQEEYTKAKGYFEMAVKYNRNNSDYFRDYAISLAKTGYMEEAEEALQQAISLGLGEDSIYMVQGEIAYQRGEDHLARESLLSAVETAQTEETALKAAGQCANVYRRMGDAYLDLEIALLENTIRRFGGSQSMYLTEQLADAYARKENYADALEHLKALYENGYATRQTMENIAIVYQQMEKMDEAEAVLKQIIEEFPQDYRAYKRLAFLEADRQQKLSNEMRNYHFMEEYYECAQSLYQKSRKEDKEMEMLEHMMGELSDGGWL